MPNFTYKAINSQGKVSVGSLEALSLEGLTEILKKQGLFLMEGKLERIAPEPMPENKLHAELKKGVDSVQLGQRLAALRLKVWDKKKTIPLHLIAVFTSEFSVMVRTGLPIISAFQSLKAQQVHVRFKTILADITRAVSEGKTLSEAFARFPDAFDPIYVSLVAAGEVSGSLPLMLERLSVYLNFQRELKEKIRMALLYPCIIVLTCLAVVTFLVFFILPTFAHIFTDMSIDLPLPTQLLLALSHHVRTWWWIYGIGLAAAWGYGVHWVAQPAHARPVDTFQMKIPVVGQLIRNVVMTRILRTLSSLVSSGVPILMSLNLTRSAAANAVFRDIIDRVYTSASQGKGLSKPLYGDRHFPQPVANMIANAEKNGTLPEVLTQAADYYEHETDLSIKKTFAVLEPVFVVLLGIMVAGIAVSVLLPIFKLDSGM